MYVIPPGAGLCSPHFKWEKDTMLTLLRIDTHYCSAPIRVPRPRPFQPPASWHLLRYIGSSIGVRKVQAELYGTNIDVVQDSGALTIDSYFVPS